MCDSKPHKKLLNRIPMDSSGDINSVDLTEDEDSRCTVIDSETGNTYPNSSQYSELLPGNYFHQRIAASSPPPLTPIPRFTVSGKVPTDQLPSVPKLTKIRRQSSINQRSPQKKGVTLISSTVVKPADNGSSIILDSDDEDVSIVPKEIKNSEIQKTTTAIPSITVSAAVSPKQPGKLVVIKKNNKLYKIVIPHNVMPTTNQVGGPVMINIPEVGPLVIRIDPQSKNHVVPKATQLEPFSLNFDEITSRASLNSVGHQRVLGGQQNKVPQMPSKDSRKSLTSKEALLSDPSFCWSYTKIRQRNKHFLLHSDYLGFSKTEIRRSKRCSRILSNILIKKKFEMQKIIDSLEEFKVKTNEKNVVKPVELSEIVGDSLDHREYVNKFGESSRQFSARELGSECISKPLGKHNVKNITLPPNTVITHSNGYDDLLMTRKVVILNENHTEMPVTNTAHLKKMNARARNLRYRQRKKAKLLMEKMMNDTPAKQDYSKLIKPCYVKMLRENYIDQMYNSLDASTCIKPKLISPKRLKVFPKPSRPKLFIQETIDKFLSKLIDTELKLRDEMSFIKPVLVLNEFNFNIVKYPVEFSKSNIVVAVDEKRNFPQAFLENSEFIDAVNNGYVKLIDSSLLCKYLVGKLGPKSPKRMDM